MPLKILSNLGQEKHDIIQFLPKIMEAEKDRIVKLKIQKIIGFY